MTTVRHAIPIRRLWPPLLATIALTLALGGVPVLAREPALPLDAYQRVLREALAAAQRGDRIGLGFAAERLVTLPAVELPDGTLVPVDNRWLQEALAEPEPDLEPVAARLGALVDELARASGPGEPAALDRLREILSRPPFDREPREPGWLEQVLEAVLRQLERWLNPAFGAGEAGEQPLAVYIIGGLSLLLIAVVLFYLIRGLVRTRTHEARARAQADPEALLTAGEALRQASDVARSGDYRSGVRLLYLSSLLWLDERGLLRYDRAQTNREYLEQVRPHPELRTRLAPIVDTFDGVWYGHLPIDATAFEQYRARVEELRTTTPQRASAREEATP